MPTIKRRTLTTVPQVIKAFGGPKAITVWAGVKVSAAKNWKTWGFIPPGWHWRIERELQRRGFEVDPKVFGVDIKAPRHSQKTGGVNA